MATTWLAAGAMALALTGCAKQEAKAPARAAGPAPGSREWKVQNAMSAAPAAIAGAATIFDFPGADGKSPQLRAGTNGWSCLPADTQRPRKHPVCWDQASGDWYSAWMNHKTPQITKPGISYMLQGAMDASNTDPYKTEPDSGQGWVVTGPHIMIMVSDVRTLAGLSTDWKSGGPYVMFAGTPYAHLMVPVAAAESAVASAMGGRTR